MYGPLAFVLNYPNAEDRKAGRTGVGIWIHGTNPDSLPLNTNGCIELENSNIKEIGSYLKNGIGTPVYIFDNDNLIDPVTFPNYRKAELKRKYVLSQYEKQRHFFISLLKKWEEAWESKDIDIYSEFYHTKKFFGQGLKWDKWKEKKSRTFEIYDTINISTNKIYLADFSETTAILKFEQEYKSDLLHVVNGKKLNFIKSMGKWKIYGENTFPKEELLL